MTDRELLEYAADALGITIIRKTMTGWDNSETDEYFQLFDDAKVGCWNPLKDDGDALRLAVAVGIDIFIDNDAPDMAATQALEMAPIGSEAIVEPHGDDGCAATRRAIVRAAARLGKAMNDGQI